MPSRTQFKNSALHIKGVIESFLEQELANFGFVNLRIYRFLIKSGKHQSTKTKDGISNIVAISPNKKVM